MSGPLNTSVKELIIGFGFLNGIWFAVGTSPENEVLNFLNKYSMSMPSYLQGLLVILPIVFVALTIITMIQVYSEGRLSGTLTVVLAFIAGAVLLKDWKASVILLALAVLLGLFSFRRRKR